LVAICSCWPTSIPVISNYPFLLTGVYSSQINISDNTHESHQSANICSIYRCSSRIHPIYLKWPIEFMVIDPSKMAIFHSFFFPHYIPHNIPMVGAGAPSSRPSSSTSIASPARKRPRAEEEAPGGERFKSWQAHPERAQHPTFCGDVFFV
jgi:hypothetical protein